MKTNDIIALANWARAELAASDDSGDTVSRIDALRRVQRVLRDIDLGDEDLPR